MSNYRVSIIIPLYNHANLIEGIWSELCLQSFQDWQLILVDNNSKDNTWTYTQELYEAHPNKIIIAQEKKQGIPFARNCGLKLANTEYVTFLDADDKFHRDKLKSMIKVLDDNPEAAMAFGLTERIYTNSDKIVIQDSGEAKKGLNYPPTLAIDWIKSFYRLPQTGATLIRTEIAKKIGGFNEELLLGNDDVGFHLKLAFNYPIYFIPEVAVHYYRHSESAGAKLNKEVSVQKRYFDAHANFVYPTALKFKNKFDQPFYYAARSLFKSFTSLKYKDNQELTLNQSLPEFYKFLLVLYSLLPFGLAELFYKTIRRPLNWLNPAKYPLD